MPDFKIKDADGEYIDVKANIMLISIMKLLASNDYLSVAGKKALNKLIMDELRKQGG